MRSKRYKKLVQTVTYAPHFISIVVFVFMITTFLNPSTGIINILRRMIGLESVHFMQYAGYFNTIYVLSGIWQGAGWGCVHIAALSAVDPDLYEAGWPLILPGAVSAYNIIVTRTFFETSVPHELFDSARIDGCTDYGYLLRIPLKSSSTG